MEKALDRQGRWRSKTVAFRVSPEENNQLEMKVRLSGMTKQDYIVSRLTDREIRSGWKSESLQSPEKIRWRTFMQSCSALHQHRKSRQICWKHCR